MQTYHNQGGIIQGRAQLVREYVGNLQDNTEALRSNFSGPSAPESPAIGQTYFNITENKEYTYTSNGWVPSDHNTSVYSEVVGARGQLANLNARLSVALNEDGTLKVPAELGVDEWKDPVYGISYVSKNSFTIPDDMTSVFTEGRAIKVVNGNTEVRTYVNSSEYNQQYNVTTVTTGNDVVASNISAVRYSIIQNGLPHNVASMSSLIREPNTAYAEKVKVLLPSLNVSMCLQCTTAGTTSSGDLVVSEPSIGNTVTDGTVVWTIKEIGGVTTKDLESHNTAAKAHADIRQDIKKHESNANAHSALMRAHNVDARAHVLDVDDTVVPTSNHGTLAAIMNNVANMLKKIKGDTDWKGNPAISLAAILGDFATNLSVTTAPKTGVFTCASLGITGLMAQNGYICLGKLFGGLILQWGTATVPTSSGVTVKFPIAFTRACFGAQADAVDSSTWGSMSGNTTYAVCVNGVTKTNLRLGLVLSIDTASTTGSARWFAYGV